MYISFVSEIIGNEVCVQMNFDCFDLDVEATLAVPQGRRSRNVRRTYASNEIVYQLCELTGDAFRPQIGRDWTCTCSPIEGRVTYETTFQDLANHFKVWGLMSLTEDLGDSHKIFLNNFQNNFNNFLIYLVDNHIYLDTPRVSRLLKQPPNTWFRVETVVPPRQISSANGTGSLPDRVGLILQLFAAGFA